MNARDRAWHDGFVDRATTLFRSIEECRGASDEIVLEKAVAEGRVLITNDKDFGEMVFRDRRAHRGIVLLRLERPGAAFKIEVLKQIIERYDEKLVDRFVVATPHQVRIVGSLQAND